MATTSETPKRDTTPKRRAADVAYDAIETMISTLQLEPGSPVSVTFANKGVTLIPPA